MPSGPVNFSQDDSIVIYHNSPSSAPDVARASLYIGGRCVEKITAEEGDENWELVISIFREARRRAFRIDEGLNIIENALNSDGVIGSPTAPPPDENAF
jgi:hypothetical protein